MRTPEYPVTHWQGPPVEYHTENFSESLPLHISVDPIRLGNAMCAQNPEISSDDLSKLTVKISPISPAIGFSVVISPDGQIANNVDSLRGRVNVQKDSDGKRIMDIYTGYTVQNFMHLRRAMQVCSSLSKYSDLPSVMQDALVGAEAVVSQNLPISRLIPYLQSTNWRDTTPFVNALLVRRAAREIGQVFAHETSHLLDIDRRYDLGQKSEKVRKAGTFVSRVGIPLIAFGALQAFDGNMDLSLVSEAAAIASFGAGWKLRRRSYSLLSTQRRLNEESEMRAREVGNNASSDWAEAVKVKINPLFETTDNPKLES